MEYLSEQIINSTISRMKAHFMLNNKPWNCLCDFCIARIETSTENDYFSGDLSVIYMKSNDYIPDYEKTLSALRDVVYRLEERKEVIDSFPEKFVMYVVKVITAIYRSSLDMAWFFMDTDKLKNTYILFLRLYHVSGNRKTIRVICREMIGFLHRIWPVVCPVGEPFPFKVEKLVI